MILLHNACVNQVIDEHHRPLLEQFMERYGLTVDKDGYLNAVLLTVSNISVTPAQIVEIAKDTEVAWMHRPIDDTGVSFDK